MKFILGAVGVVVLLFIVIIVLFNRGGDDSAPDTKKAAQLVDYVDKNSSVSQTTIGKLVGEEEHRDIRIVVTPTERRLEVLSGYDQSVISNQTYPNTKSAYENFLSALGGQGFLTSRKSSITDQRSACPTGYRYIYDLSENGNHVSNLWSTSCGDKGTFAGRGGTIRDLFQRQIPEYNTLVRDYQL